MFERATYKDEKHDWTKIKDPVASLKRDGAMFWLEVQSDGSFKFHSRRPSVSGGHPERSEKLPALTTKKLPEYAGHIFTVELVHTGKTKSDKDNHGKLSGILNSLPPKAVQTQKDEGPVRAVLHDVINPALPTYKDKLLHMKAFEKAYGKPDVMFVVHPHIGLPAITKLMESSRFEGHEGMIVTSLTEPESRNPRVKVKHTLMNNLSVVGMTQEYDIYGKPKQSMGALKLADNTGKEVGLVGTGFTREQREEYWKDPSKIIGEVVQVKHMGYATNAIRHPVWNGFADTNIPDRISP
jgi:hypothetical protein